MTSAGLSADVVLLCGHCTALGSRQKKEAEEEGGARRDPQYDPDVPHSVIAQVPVIALGADAGVPIALAVPMQTLLPRRAPRHFLLARADLDRLFRTQNPTYSQL